MRKHSAKRFVSKDKIKSKKKDKNVLNFSKIVLIIFTVIVTILIIIFSKDFFNKSSSVEEPTKNNTESFSLSNMLSENDNVSQYVTKKFDNTDLFLKNLFLKYENNITVISFNICNESLTDQDTFYFTFSLLDENNNVIISYDLCSEGIIQSKMDKEFILIATKDVSNASDFIISIKK